MNTNNLYLNNVKNNEDSNVYSSNNGMDDRDMMHAKINDMNNQQKIYDRINDGLYTGNLNKNDPDSFVLKPRVDLDLNSQNNKNEYDFSKKNSDMIDDMLATSSPQGPNRSEDDNQSKEKGKENISENENENGEETTVLPGKSHWSYKYYIVIIIGLIITVVVVVLGDEEKKSLPGEEDTINNNDNNDDKDEDKVDDESETNLGITPVLSLLVGGFLGLAFGAFSSSSRKNFISNKGNIEIEKNLHRPKYNRFRIFNNLEQKVERV